MPRPDDVRRAVYLLRDAGFDNISLDLIYGIPGQSAADLERDLAEALALEPEHLSAYELEAKPGTRFTHAHGAELERQAESMESYFELVVETLTAAGYRWYETANFCRARGSAGGRDLRARHNLGYWLGHDYLGLGVGAVSTIEERRWRNAPSLARYLAALGGGRPASAGARGAAGSSVRETERVMLGLRLDEPLALVEVADGCSTRRARAARRPRARAERHDDSLALTPRGRFLGDGVTALAACLSAVEAHRAAYHDAGHECASRAVRAAAGDPRPASSRSTSRRARRWGRRLLVERAGFDGLDVDGAGRARRARAARAAHASAHLRRARADRGRLPRSTSTSCSRARSRARPSFRSSSGRARAEVEEALQATTEMLSQVTRLLALVSAPPLEAATVRHVDVLQLQPNVVVVVVITSTGEVTKQRYAFPEPVDPGLVTWAGDYLRERLTGLRLRSRLLARAFDEPGLVRARARVSRRRSRSAFDGLEEERELYVGGAAGLLDDLRAEEIGAYRSLIDALEKRAALLDVLAQSLGLQRPFVRVGDELEESGLHKLALVGASYGYSNQPLGTVSLLGPLRMDYEKALRAVRAAAYELSRIVEEVYGDE